MPMGLMVVGRLCFTYSVSTRSFKKTNYFTDKLKHRTNITLVSFKWGLVFSKLDVG